MSDNRFCIDYAKRPAGCKKCKVKIEKGELRIAKITPSPFSDDGEMKNYHHPACIFDTFKRVKATTKIIEDPGDLEGWSEVNAEDRKTVLSLIEQHQETKNQTPQKAKKGPSAKGTPQKDSVVKKDTSPTIKKPKPDQEGKETLPSNSGPPVNPNHKDNSVREFRRLCAAVADVPGHLDKSALISKWLSGGSSKNNFEGDLLLWVRLLLPGVVKRVYNMQSRQLVKVFARIFSTDEEEMVDDLSEGDVAETIGKFYEQSKTVVPPKKSELGLHQVDAFLDQLAGMTKEEEQQHLLARVTKVSTVNDLKIFVRIMKGDLRIGAGAKHILDGVHPDAYEAFNSSRNIKAVVDQVLEVRAGKNPKGRLHLGISLLQPVQPMLAQACKSVDMAFTKCPNGLYSEIKYDGERVQLHKSGAEFKYFSRNLKPVMGHKVKHFAEHIPKAFPSGASLILDAEVLMLDVKTNKPLPFGTLGIHKGGGFKDAVPCLFVFDILFYNGESWMERPMKERRQLLESQMKEVGHSVKLSELTRVTKKSQLAAQIKSVLEQGLEGLVIKDALSTYEPGKRHWLKVKKDYLAEGSMADSADLVVLGGWCGTGKKGGQISTFLMGVRDEVKGRWCTVTKVALGFDDATLARLQNELAPTMDRIAGEYDRVPHWLDVTRQMVPEFIVRKPEESPVWEVTGAEFSKAEIHTAGGISIRFPRMTRMRTDKSVETATSLAELRHLYTESKKHIDINVAGGSDEERDEEDTKTKIKKVKGEHSTPKRKVEVDEAGPSPKRSKLSKEENEDTKAHKKVNLVEERTGDLFSAAPTMSLAHCISRDCAMRKGIAKQFRDKFGRVDEIVQQKAQVGGVAPLKLDKGRYIYNLVTKEKYFEKPTMATLRSSLLKMEEHMVRKGIEEVAMPRIGCGLDLLEWRRVKELLEEVFKDSGKKIVVFTRKEDEIKSNSQEKRRWDDGEDKKGEKSKNEEKVKEKRDRKRKTAEDSKIEVGHGFVTSNPLPDVFLGMSAVLMEGLGKREALERFFVAFGGRSLPMSQLGEATHVIYPEGSSGDLAGKSNKRTFHVIEQWLEDSIKLKECQEEKLYKLR